MQGHPGGDHYMNIKSWFNPTFWSLQSHIFWRQWLRRMTFWYSFQILENSDKWGVDMFRIHTVTDKRTLTCITYTIFQVKIKRQSLFSLITMKTCQCNLWKSSLVNWHLLLSWIMQFPNFLISSLLSNLYFVLRNDFYL